MDESEQPELYARLMEIQQKVTMGLDEDLAKHNVKIDQFEDKISGSASTIEEAAEEAELESKE